MYYLSGIFYCFFSALFVFFRGFFEFIFDFMIFLVEFWRVGSIPYPVFLCIRLVNSRVIERRCSIHLVLSISVFNERDCVAIFFCGCMAGDTAGDGGCAAGDTAGGVGCTAGDTAGDGGCMAVVLVSFLCIYICFFF